MFDKSETKKLAWAIAGYSSASILGPMLLFGAVGIFLDKHFDSKPKILLVCMGIAFIFSNILLFRKRNYLMKKNLLNNNFEEKKKEK